MSGGSQEHGWLGVLLNYCHGWVGGWDSDAPLCGIEDRVFFFM